MSFSQEFLARLVGTGDFSLLRWTDPCYWQQLFSQQKKEKTSLHETPAEVTNTSIQKVPMDNEQGSSDSVERSAEVVALGRKLLAVAKLMEEKKRKERAMGRSRDDRGRIWSLLTSAWSQR